MCDRGETDFYVNNITKHERITRSAYWRSGGSPRSLQQTITPSYTARYVAFRPSWKSYTIK